MSPPEVWGPAIWTLFHTLAEKINPDAYSQVSPSMFNIIVQICKFLPCPDCSRDASIFLAKIKLSDYRNKTEFKNMLYLFHNYVNSKKRKPLYNYANMNKYENINLIYVINNFISKYNTKGNMKLLTETFQRSFVIKNFINWFNIYKKAFIIPSTVNITQSVQKNLATEEPVVEETLATEEPVVEETLADEEQFLEETLVTEEPVVEETLAAEEPVVEETLAAEEPVIEETLATEEQVVEETLAAEEHVVEETTNKIIEVQQILVENQVKTKRGRKNKSKK